MPDPAAQNLWLVLGAGVSAAPPANAPLWYEIQADTIEDIARTLKYQVHQSGGDAESLVQATLEIIPQAMFPEMVMDCLCRAYGREGVTRKMREVIEPKNQLEPNRAHKSIAALCREGRVGGIITTNFDRYLEAALDQAGVVYQVCTRTPPEAGMGLPVLKLHGSIEQPQSLAFLRQDYYFGLPGEMTDFLRKSLRDCLLVIAGYSGNDIDVYPLLKTILLDPSAGNRAVIVDLKDQQENLRFLPLQEISEYVREPAGAFFARMAGVEAAETVEPQRARRWCSMVPFAHKFECAVFLADSLLEVREYPVTAFRLFFLAQDIVEEELGDLAKLSKIFFGKALSLYAMNDNEYAESEYSQGRTTLDQFIARSGAGVDPKLAAQFGYALRSLEKSVAPRTFTASGFLGQTVMRLSRDRFSGSEREGERLRDLLAWEFRARVQTGFAALAAANRQATGGRDAQMLGIPEILFAGMEGWQSHFDPAMAREEVVILPLIYALFFKGYVQYLRNEAAAASTLRACLQTCRETGYFLGSAYCLYLLQQIDPHLEPGLAEEYATILNYCGTGEETHIRPQFSNRGEAFRLSISTYKPPV